MFASILSPELSKAQLEGAARLFAGWGFQQRRPMDRSKLPKALKDRLLAHALSSADQDKRDRATDAFGSQ